MRILGWMMMTAALSASQWIVASEASACGVTVPVEGETASVNAQRVIMGYNPESETTRVVAQIAQEGDVSAFSWLIPLPSEPTEITALGEEGTELFQGLDDFSKPLFAVTCFGWNNGGSGEPVDAEGVTVLDAGTTGTFEYVVLTGTGGTVVTDWLAAEGYGLPDGMADVIHTYIREGQLFLAMKINPEALGVETLDPGIRFDYQGRPGYPLRILQPTTTDEVEIILTVISPEPAQITSATKVEGVAWTEEQLPVYLDEVREADGWVVEYSGEITNRDHSSEAGDLSVDVSERTKTLIQEVLGQDPETAKLSRFHGIFSPEQLAADTPILTTGGELYSAFYEKEYWDCSNDADEDYYDDDYEDGADEEAGQTPTDDPMSSEPTDDPMSSEGCSTTAGTTDHGGLILLFGLALMRLRRRR